MELVILFAELLANPRSIATYRKLSDHYKSCNLANEAAAIDEVTDRKADGHSSLADEEQRPNDPPSP